jgi:ATP-dependent DNA helicase RecQ
LENEFHLILNKYWGYDSFKGSQELIIRNIFSNKDTLALLPTGGGKSICYQIPALAKEGVCIVISPLIALMMDQVNHLKKKNINAECIHSNNSKKDIDRILDNCIYGNVKLLYLSPERIKTTLFKERFKKMNVSFIAIDEAHCISQWGYDFRPSYLEISELRIIKPEISFIALTATATSTVCADIQQKLLFKVQNTIRDSFLRKNLCYSVLNPINKYDFLVTTINKKTECTIIYVRTRKMCVTLFNLLKSKRIKSTIYHAGLDYKTRTQSQEKWMDGTIDIMIATSAFGMGIDKQNVRTVINFDIPESIESYYQEAGRAGRDNNKANSILLVENSDKTNLINRIKKNYPSLEIIKNIYQKFCNIQQIAIGSGQDNNYPLNYNTISSLTEYSTLEVFHAFRLIELSGYITISNSKLNSSELKIELSKRDLVQFIEKNNNYKDIVNVLIRSYSSIMDNYVSINELLLTKRINKNIKQTELLLKRLDTLNIVSYKQNTSDINLIFNSPRVDVKSLEIKNEIYSDKIKNDLERVNSILDYSFNHKTCRNKILLNYFGENLKSDCLICDNCKGKHNENLNEISLDIINNLKEKPIEIDDLYNKLMSNHLKNNIKKVLRNMMDNNKVKMNDLNLIELINK